MSARRCENCSRWSSTDQVWGECTVASRYANGQRSHATYIEEPGRVLDACLETRHDFGCVEWKSYAAVAKRVAQPVT